MSLDQWDPRCARGPVVLPLCADPAGLSGPTPRQARGAGWRRASRGWFVPASVPLTVEQRICEAAVRLPPAGAVTAWAALRWHGAAYFDGLDLDGAPLPVPLLLGGAGANLRPMAGSTVTKEQFPPGELVSVDGLRCSSPLRAVFDEVRRVGSHREGAVVIDMTAAAGLLTVADLVDYVRTRQAWLRVPLVRRAVALASDHSRSPQETRMRLVWVLDAQLPPPLCNRPVFSRRGELLGYPDLLDPVAGVVGEYDGADHQRRDRRQRDITREQRFRDHGLEYFTVVRGDLTDRPAVARRMLAAVARARQIPPARRQWTLDPPAWWQAA